MKKRTSYILIISIFILGLVLDLVSKHLFAQYFAEGKPDIEVIPGFFKFTFMKNTGAAYGIFSNSTLMLSIASGVFVVIFVIYDIFNHSNSVLYTLGFSLIISGAVGNLVDRIFLGYVRDFVSISIFHFVFNIADLLITVGVVLFMIHLIISIVKEQKGKKKNEVVDNK